MSRYTNWGLLTGRYPNAAKLSGSSQNTESYFIVGAEDELDGWLAGRYTVPFSPAPSAVIDLATDMAWYKMCYSEKFAEPLKASIDARLKAIIEGKFVLTTSGTSQDVSRYASAETDYHSVFGHDDPIEWTVDSDQIDDEQDARL